MASIRYVFEGGGAAGDERRIVIGPRGDVCEMVLECILISGGSSFVDPLSDIEYDAGETLGVDVDFLIIWDLANIACKSQRACGVTSGTVHLTSAKFLGRPTVMAPPNNSMRL